MTFHCPLICHWKTDERSSYESTIISTKTIYEPKEKKIKKYYPYRWTALYFRKEEKKHTPTHKQRRHINSQLRYESASFTALDYWAVFTSIIISNEYRKGFRSRSCTPSWKADQQKTTNVANACSHIFNRQGVVELCCAYAALRRQQDVIERRVAWTPFMQLRQDNGKKE